MRLMIILAALLVLASCNANTRSNGVSNTQNTENMQEANNFYDITMNDIDGNEINFSQFEGKKVLVVNVASKCGYTPQYAELQELHSQYQDKVVVLGFPANNFGGQEPGTLDDIKKFCSENYGVTFPMFEKISVKGANKHPLYRWLSDKNLNGWNDQEPTWNFCKYFINEKGELKRFFPSSVNPLDDDIIELIKA